MKNFLRQIYLKNYFGRGLFYLPYRPSNMQKEGIPHHKSRAIFLPFEMLARERLHQPSGELSPLCVLRCFLTTPVCSGPSRYRVVFPSPSSRFRGGGSVYAVIIFISLQLCHLVPSFFPTHLLVCPLLQCATQSKF